MKILNLTEIGLKLYHEKALFLLLTVFLASIYVFSAVYSFSSITNQFTTITNKSVKIMWNGKK